MASYYLGPETPRPFAVISEDSMKMSKLPHIPEYELFSFGPVYEKKLCELIHKHLELGTDDRLCYVGEHKGSLAPILQDRFCILQPITTVVPGHVHFEESPNHRMVPIKLAHVGAEEYFAGEAEKGAKFDKLLFKDAVQFFGDPVKTYKEAAETMAEFGKMLIIHRPAPMNSLPLFTDARDRLEENDAPYMKIIHDLQKGCLLDVQWEIECLPVVMPKVKWYAMLHNKYPSQLEMVSPLEVRCGIRELSEGVLKYEGDVVEFSDRLLFITATKRIFSEFPALQRFSASQSQTADLMTSQPELRYQMKVTSDIRGYVNSKLDAEQRRKDNRIMREMFK